MPQSGKVKSESHRRTRAARWALAARAACPGRPLGCLGCQRPGRRASPPRPAPTRPAPQRRTALSTSPKNSVTFMLVHHTPGIVLAARRVRHRRQPPGPRCRSSVRARHPRPARSAEQAGKRRFHAHLVAGGGSSLWRPATAAEGEDRSLWAWPDLRWVEVAGFGGGGMHGYPSLQGSFLPRRPVRRPPCRAARPAGPRRERARTQLRLGMAAGRRPWDQAG